MNVNVRTSKNETALIVATKNGNFDVVKILLDNGADIDAKDDEGKTALDWSKEKGNNDIFNILSS